MIQEICHKCKQNVNTNDIHVTEIKINDLTNDISYSIEGHLCSKCFYDLLNDTTYDKNDIE